MLQMIFRKGKKQSPIDDQPMDQGLKTGIQLPSFSAVAITGSFWDLFVAWRASRRWSALLACVIPLLLAGSVLACVAASKLVANSEKLAWYGTKADEQLKLLHDAKENEKPTVDNLANIDVSRNNYIELLFKRVLQLEENNKLARFYVASNMARYGRVGAAMVMMQELAPANDKGLELAHEWIAQQMINQAQRGQQLDIALLKHHLKHATSKQDFSPILLLLYSQLLQQESNVEEATALLKKAASSDTRLQLNATAIFMQRGMQGQATAAADALIKEFSKKFDDDPTDEYRLLVAQAYSLSRRLDQAINVLQEGVRLKPNSGQMRRALSNALRFKFRTTIVKASGQVRMGLDYLNIAIAADPTNEGVQDELTLVASLGLSTTEPGIESLRKQIAVGGTSYAARLLLAEAAYRKNDLDDAINNFELILAELPNMTLAINNLAMIMAKRDPTKVKESIELINKAIEINPKFAEYYDTRGELYLIDQRKEETIEDFKKVVELDPGRVATHERIIAMYRELGRESDALEHEKILAKVRELIALRKEQQAQNDQAKKDASDNQAQPNSTSTGTTPTDSTSATSESTDASPNATPNATPSVPAATDTPNSTTAPKPESPASETGATIEALQPKETQPASDNPADKNAIDRLLGLQI